MGTKLLLVGLVGQFCRFQPVVPVFSPELTTGELLNEVVDLVQRTSIQAAVRVVTLGVLREITHLVYTDDEVVCVGGRGLVGGIAMTRSRLSRARRSGRKEPGGPSGRAARPAASPDLERGLYGGQGASAA